jgi:hypothetical protein
MCPLDNDNTNGMIFYAAEGSHTKMSGHKTGGKQTPDKKQMPVTNDQSIGKKNSSHGCFGLLPPRKKKH